MEGQKFDRYEDYLDRLLDQGHTATDISSALFTMLRETIGREGERIAEDDPNFSNQQSEPGRGRKNRKKKFGPARKPGEERKRKDFQGKREKRKKSGKFSGQKKRKLKKGKSETGRKRNFNDNSKASSN